MKTHRYLLALFLFFSLFADSIAAKDAQKPYTDYILKYRDLAVYHMQKYQIPASITLAQGILETGGGRSTFVKESNNHFGIKCNEWKGEKYYKADDGPNDCFRGYKNAEESFEDHSLFLKRKYYEKLFLLKITDYKGWANGLQECGYATDRFYAKKLIKIIKDYKLTEYDKIGKQSLPETAPEMNPGRELHRINGLTYVIAEANDSYEKIATETDSKVSDLWKYNEVLENFPIKEGDIVYLQKKKTKADKPYFEHIIRTGESMHSISQQYGIQINRLYKLNRLYFDFVPKTGDVLRLR
jgi:LysM repeat protein